MSKEIKEIIEGNKLIDIFMNPKHTISGYWIHWNDGHGSQSHVETLEYHSSWDWLMPVVEKMSKIKCTWTNVEPHETDTYYPRTFGMLNAETKRPMVRINSNSLFEADTLIEATWLAVINFITWYNQQNT